MGKTCFLCKSVDDDEVLYGQFYTKGNLSVHYYCLLLSSNLVQNGVNDEAGIFGFLPADIRRENERTKKCRCYICKQMHANVFCCAKNCLRTFHTVCGIKNRCHSHYTDTFQSWCSQHVPLKAEQKPHSTEELCSICYEDMGAYDKITSIRAPCCKNGWFHQRCVARFAQTAGYFFKCPLCNNVDTFTQEIPLRGVFVPERDAAWELEPNAFQEQLVRPSVCDAEECKCRHGRETDNRHWNLLICGSCGSTCRHRECMVSPSSRTYVCHFCHPIVGADVSMLTGDNEGMDNGASSSAESVSDDDKRHDFNDEKCPTFGSGESGVHFSSSDESSLNFRGRRRRVKGIAIQSSDSEQSESSSIVIRRSVQRNTGKRVRRVISDDTEDTDSKEDARNREKSKPGGVGERNDAPSGSLTDESAEPNGEPMSENSSTSGTSSIRIIRRSGKFVHQRNRFDSSVESDESTGSTVQPKRKPAANSKPSKTTTSIPVVTMVNDSDSSDDDVPLAKRRCMAPPTDSKQTGQTVDRLNTSNEENISPKNSQVNNLRHTHSRPPSERSKATTGNGTGKTDETLASRGRLQQSILKFITSSGRKAQTETQSDVSPKSDHTDSPGSSTGNVSTERVDSSVMKREPGKRKPSTVAAKRTPQSRSRTASSISPNETTGKGENTPEPGNARRRRWKSNVVDVEKGQLNLMNYFNRC